MGCKSYRSGIITVGILICLVALTACSSAFKVISTIPAKSQAEPPAVVMGRLLISDNGELSSLQNAVLILKNKQTGKEFEFHFGDEATASNLFWSLAEGDYTFTALQFYQRDRATGELGEETLSIIQFPSGPDFKARAKTICYLGSIFVSVWDAAVSLKIENALPEMREILKNRYKNQKWTKYRIVAAFESKDGHDVQAAEDSPDAAGSQEAAEEKKTTEVKDSATSKETTAAPKPAESPNPADSNVAK
jgi:hypothetical protein